MRVPELVGSVFAEAERGFDPWPIIFLSGRTGTNLRITKRTIVDFELGRVGILFNVVGGVEIWRTNVLVPLVQEFESRVKVVP